jgi:hypothetical protein
MLSMKNSIRKICPSCSNYVVAVVLLSSFTGATIILAFCLLSTPFISDVLSLEDQKALAANASNTTVNATTLSLGSPFYTEKDKTTSSNLITINGIHAARVTFSGNGTANGVNFTDKGIALISAGPNGDVHIQGIAAIIGQNGEKGNFTFREVGHVSTSDGKTRAAGVAFFSTINPTGKLAFLTDLVAIYKDVIDKSGNGLVTAWEWRY